MLNVVCLRIDIERTDLYNVVKSEFFVDAVYILPTPIFVTAGNGIQFDGWNEINKEFSSIFSIMKHISDINFIEKTIDRESRYFNFLKNINNVFLWIKEFETKMNIVEEMQNNLLNMLIDREIYKLDYLIKIIEQFDENYLVFRNINKKLYIDMLDSIVEYLKKYRVNNLELFV